MLLELLGCAFIAVSVWLILSRKQLKINVLQSLLLACVHVLIGSLGAKMLGWIESGLFGSPLKAPLRLFGSVAVMPLMYYLVAKWKSAPIRSVMDCAAIATMLGLAAGRFLCIVQGCCDGVPIPEVEEYNWPIRELEIVYYLVMIVLFCNKTILNKGNGYVYPLLMTTYGVFRFVIEWVRAEFSFRIGPLHIGHIWSIICVLIGIDFYIYLAKKGKKERGL